MKININDFFQCTLKLDSSIMNFSSDLFAPRRLDSCPCCENIGNLISPNWVNNGGFLILIIAMIAMFWGLAAVCKEYFVPALNVLCEEWKIPSDVAGATFMAAGASSPELFTSLIGLLVDQSNIGVGTVVGSEIFNHMIISAGSVLYAKGGVLQLDQHFVLRDLITYMLSVLILIYSIENDIVGALANTFDTGSWSTCLSVTTLHCSVLLAMYFVYAIICGNFQRITELICPGVSSVAPLNPSKYGESGISEGNLGDRANIDDVEQAIEVSVKHNSASRARISYADQFPARSVEEDGQRRLRIFGHSGDDVPPHVRVRDGQNCQLQLLMVHSTDSTPHMWCHLHFLLD
jgi:hypothetical protein